MWVFLWLSLDYFVLSGTVVFDQVTMMMMMIFVLALFAFIVLTLVSSVLCQEIGCEERLRYNLFCVELDVKP